MELTAEAENDRDAGGKAILKSFQLRSSWLDRAIQPTGVATVSTASVAADVESKFDAPDYVENMLSVELKRHVLECGKDAFQKARELFKRTLSDGA